MRKTYITPEVEIKTFQTENVLCASVDATFNPNVDDVWGGDVTIDPDFND